MKTSDFSPIFVGNNAALDFVNTQVVQHGELVDLLTEDADLTRWAGATGRELKNLPGNVDLKDAKSLRGALSELFKAKIEGATIAENSLAVVNKHLAAHAQHELLQINDASELELVADKGATSLTALLAELAYEGARLLASPQASHIKCCGNPECVLLFLDTSRTRKRRWCSMETCGNRAKAARHYRSKSQ